MPTETVDKPLPTPHPDDASEPAGPIRQPAFLPDPQPANPEDPDAPVYDSCLDDLTLKLTQPAYEPDPALKSKSSTDDGSGSARGGGSGHSSRKDRGKQPRTSEVFGELGSRAGEGSLPATEREMSVQAGRSSGASVRDKLIRPWWTRRSQSAKVLISHGSAFDDDEQLGEPRMLWFLLALLAYATTITAALVWLFWTGRIFGIRQVPASDVRPVTPEPSPAPADPARSLPLPAIPVDNVAKLGIPIRIGDVEVTPIAIVSSPVELLRFVDDPPEYRREDTDSLILRLKVTNLSNDHHFAPLDRDLIRGPSAPLDRTQITSSKGETIRLYPLAVESEWVIQGQQFPVLKPGETTETVLATEAVTDDRLAGDLTWRVRLRIGTYRTDILAVRFNIDDVSL
jgi:hypothetical protein